MLGAAAVALQCATVWDLGLWPARSRSDTVSVPFHTLAS